MSLEETPGFHHKVSLELSYEACVIAWSYDSHHAQHTYAHRTEITQFLTSVEGVTFQAQNREETYAWVEETLRSTQYLKADRETKGIVRKYVQKATGYARAHVARLVRKFRTTNQVRVREYRRHRFPRKFTDHDVSWLAQADQAHRVLSGLATKRILQREHLVYGRPEFARLAEISVSHL